MRYTLITILFLSFNLFSYNENKYIHIVLPSNETPQVITKGDAADDPSIWLNSLYPEKSLIFGTDKRSGIYIYDLSADIVSYNEIGNINNVDIRTVKYLIIILKSMTVKLLYLVQIEQIIHFQFGFIMM